MTEKFLFLCNCGWKKISALNGNIGIVELKNDTLSNRKFRCPKCGFAITPRKSKDPQSELDNKMKSIETAEENKKWLEESAEKQSEFIKEMQNAEEDNDQ